MKKVMNILFTLWCVVFASLVGAYFYVQHTYEVEMQRLEGELHKYSKEFTEHSKKIESQMPLSWQATYLDDEAPR